MKTIAILWILVVLTLPATYAQRDCDFVYHRQAVDHIIKWNLLPIELRSQLINIEQKGTKTVLHLDSSIRNNFAVIYNDYGSSKSGPFELTFKDSSYKRQTLRNYYVNDIQSKALYPLMTSSFAPDYLWYPDFHVMTSQILFENINCDRKREIIGFDFKTRQLQKIKTNNFGSVIGSTDTSILVFIKNREVQIDNKEFKEGEIVSASLNGTFKIVASSQQDENSLFYNGTFGVKKKLIYQDTFECNKFDHIIYYVSLNNKVVDSITIKLQEFANNDIPKIENNRNRLTLSTEDFYKVYFASGLIHTWDSKTWENEIQILRTCNSKQYLLVGDSLFIVANIDITKQAPILSENGNTLNSLPFNTKATDYQTVLLFNLSRNAFLGYPTIEFNAVRNSK